MLAARPGGAACKNIRDDKGDWSKMDAYLVTHAGVQFTHGFCPECLERLYPDLDNEG